MGRFRTATDEVVLRRTKMVSKAFMDKIIRAKRYLDDEIVGYQAAEKINGYLNESQKEAHSALYTARLCVERVMDELEIEVK